ncbi:glycoside hydrolase family 92 protein, partial [Zobellia sp.]|nr:glycoside hydrolase family 92 protein [Zobellia sp.]
MKSSFSLKKSFYLIGIALVFISSCKNHETTITPIEKKKPIDYTSKVYPLLDTENSRWFFLSSASRPFGMVNLSPDNQIGGAWGSGYRYKTDTIKGFSHIHAWQMSGISVMPVTVPKNHKDAIYTNFYSKFSHK